jgi:predicted porin
MFAKKIVAGAALLAVAAVAHADVKVYGMLDLSVGSFKDYEFTKDKLGNVIDINKGKALTKVESGSMMTSYIGFAGDENLGGGLKAEFAIESFITPDTGGTAKNMAGGFWGRGTFVALSGGFGKVALGQYDNAMFTFGYTYNPFGSSMTFAPTMVSYYSGGALATLGYDTGWVNSITYESPVIAGFQGVVQVAPKETAAGGDAKNNFALSGSYNAGPLSLMAVYTNSGVSVPAYTARQKNFALGGSYDFGVAKAMAQYSQVKDTTGGVDSKKTFLQVGASVPVTAADAVLVSYGQTKYDFGGDATGKLKQFSLGVDHTLSKRTDAYAALTSKKLTDVGTVNTFAVGIKHNF